MIRKTAPSPVRSLLGVATVVLILTACGPQPLDVTQEPVTLHLVACDTCTSLMEDLAATYQSERAWVTLNVEAFNTAVVEAQFRSQAADLFALPPTDSIQLPPWSVPFATNAIVVVVHPTTSVEAMDTAQLREVFRGRIGEWENGTPIQIVSREAGAGTRTIFEARVMEGQDVALTAVVMPGDEEVLDYVASTPGAIGYVALSRLNDEVRTLAVNGVTPTPSALEAYPLAFPLYLTAPSEPDGAARAFVQWVLSLEGQRQIERFLGRSQ
jgi:phosphate transport system substrate-binding protein